MEAELNQPVVIDNGSGLIKAGFAGEEVPKLVFPAYVGRPKHKKVMNSQIEMKPYVGAKAEEHRGLMKIKYPTEHGIVTDWPDEELLWAHAFAELKADPQQHPVLLTEAPLNPRRNREKAAEVMFETLNVPALFVSLQAVLSLYASGRTTGVVLDVGDGVSHSVPIYEGFVVPTAIERNNLAGRDVTNHLQLLLKKAGTTFNTSAEREVVRGLKEAVCYVAFDPQKEEEQLESEARGKSSAAQYRLPDGRTIDVGSERFRAPEILFRPDVVGEELLGVHELVMSSVMKTDLDLRRSLFSSVVLSGGSTLFPGFGARLLNELQAKSSKELRIKIFAPPERKYVSTQIHKRYSTWIGGSILAGLPTFKRIWVTRKEYEDEGAAVVHRKCF